MLRRTYSRLYQIQLRHVRQENLDSLSEYHRRIVENLRDGKLDALRNLSVQSYMHSRTYYLSNTESGA